MGLYAFDKMKEVTESVEFDVDENDDDDDDDDENKEVDNAQIDVFGNVKQRLEKNKCVYTDSRFDDDEKGDNPKRARLFADTFKTFKTEQISKQYKGNEAINYPHKHRFCAFVDRRKPDDGDKKDYDISKKDELIFFEPPKDCNSFPKEKAQPLFYFDTSRTCIIPNDDYKPGKMGPGVNANGGGDQKKKLLEQPVTSTAPASAASIMLSFHVEASDEIRCYMYINGQVMRFMPSDIINLLPLFFDKTFGDNADFAQSKRAQQLVDEMKKNLRDVRFNAFMKKYQSKGKDQ